MTKTMFVAAMLIGLPVLAFDFGRIYQIQEPQKPCPVVEGERLAYSTKYEDGRVECMYVRNTRGLATSMKRVP